MEVLNNFVMPRTQRGAGRTGSKYLTDAQFDAIKALNIKDAVIFPFLPDVKESRQRQATMYYVTETIAKHDDLKNRNYICGVVPDKGIAVQRVDDKAIAAPTQAAPATEAPAQVAA